MTLVPTAPPREIAALFVEGENAMNMIDAAGHRVSGACAQSLALFEQSARELLCLVDDPAATAERAIAASPQMTMAHVLKAWLHLLGAEPAGVAVARDSPRPLPGSRPTSANGPTSPPPRRWRKGAGRKPACGSRT